MLIPNLYAAGLISNPVFGFYLGAIGEDSYLDIGIILDAAMRDPSEIVWLPVLNDNFWWMNSIDGIRITNYKGESNSYGMHKVDAMTDTGTSCTYIPKKYYGAVMSRLLDEMESVSADKWGSLYVPCNKIDKMPTI